jgi:hypothetical protein
MTEVSSITIPNAAMNRLTAAAPFLGNGRSVEPIPVVKRTERVPRASHHDTPDDIDATT